MAGVTAGDSDSSRANDKPASLLALMLRHLTHLDLVHFSFGKLAEFLLLNFCWIAGSILRIFSAFGLETDS
jgi:hypothetical protein